MTSERTICLTTLKTMDEKVLIEAWNRARLHIVISQLAPTFLLIATVAIMPLGLAKAPLVVKVAALGILLASGILGAVAQYSAATEAIAISEDLKKTGAGSSLSASIQSFAPWMNVVRFVTPAIFVVIFVFLAIALLVPSA